MEEVINIVGSINQWLMWANLIAVISLSWSISYLVGRVRHMQHQIDALDRGAERQAGVLAKIGKHVYRKGKL